MYAYRYFANDKSGHYSKYKHKTDSVKGDWLKEFFGGNIQI